MLAVAALATAAVPFQSPVLAQPGPAPAPALPGDQTLDVWMLDVGQGSCVYVQCPDRRRAMLIDCGSTSDSPRVTKKKVADWIDDRTETVDTFSVVISHGDTDHYSLLPSLKPERVDQVRMGGVQDDFAAVQGWLDDVAEEGGDVGLFPANTFAANAPGFQCEPARVDVLVASAAQGFPQMSVRSRKNADSAVIRVSFGGASIVLPGDAEGMTQRLALKNAADAGLALTDPALLLGSHHGARTKSSNNETWVKFWKAPIAAFSASLDVRHGHPQCEVVGRFDQFTERVAKPFAVPCGVGSDNPKVRIVRGKVLSTYGNGHVLFRFGQGRVEILCQILTPACDGPIPASMLPA